MTDKEPTDPKNAETPDEDLSGMEQIQPKLDYLIICDAVAAGPDGRKTIYGIFDRVVFPGFPAMYPQCSIITRWTYGTGTHKLRVKILDPDKNMIFDPRADLEFRLANPLISADIVLQIQGLRFNKPGTYWIQVFLNGDKLEEEHRLKIDGRK